VYAKRVPKDPSDRTPAWRSRSEERTAANLDDRGIPYVYEGTVLSYVRPATKANYTPDFELPNGTFVEVKGYWDSEDRQKLLMVKRDNPDLIIRLLFDTPDKPILKGSKTTYAMFATKHGFEWAKGPTIPDDWLK